MNGSRSAGETPANARRTGKPSPSKPRGAVVTDLTRRMVDWLASSAVTRGRLRVLSTVIAGILVSTQWLRTKLDGKLFRLAGDQPGSNGLRFGARQCRPPLRLAC